MEDDTVMMGLKDKLSRKINFHAQYYNESHLKRRLKVRMYSTKNQTFEEYSSYLDRCPGEYDVLKNVLTVNVTEFFRNPETFEAVKREVLSDLVESKMRNGKKNLRIWSAGCSDGKEPYSIAMLIHEALGEGVNDFKPMIFATDIDDQMLAKGISGFYKHSEVNGLSNEIIGKYFIEEEGGFQVTPGLRSMIKFEKRDLITERKFPILDIIFCRNVVIYFTSKLKERLYMDFYNCLSNRGFFIMGKTETLVGEARNSFIPYNNKERIYVKDQTLLVQ